MTMEPKVTDPYDIVLADLFSKKEQIDKAIQAIEMVRGISAPSAMPNKTQHQNESVDSAGAFLGMSISEATIKLLRSKRKQMNNSEILSSLLAGGMVLNSAEPINTIGAVITRRYKEVGDIVKIGRGIWGLKEWYPGRKFNKNNSDDAKEEDATDLA